MFVNRSTWQNGRVAGGRRAQVLQPLYRLRLFAATSSRQSLLLRSEGQALIEYALIVSLIALIAIAALKLTGTNVSKILNTIAGEV
jgi:Flp pilus assembly pilin Flp